MVDIIKRYQQIIKDITAYSKNPTEQNAFKVAEGFQEKFESEVEFKEEGFPQTQLELGTSAELAEQWFDKANNNAGNSNEYPTKSSDVIAKDLISEGRETGNLGALVNAYGIVVLNQGQPGMDALKDQVIAEMNDWKPQASLDSELRTQFAQAHDAIAPTEQAPMNVAKLDISLPGMSA